MKKIVKIYLFVLIGVLYTSCQNSINDMPQSYIDVNDILVDSTYVIGLVDDMYGSLPTGYSRLGGTSMMASATDEAVESPNNTEAENMAIGVWAASNTRDDVWATMYNAIRKTNVFLNEVHPIIPQVLFKSENTVKLLTGQTYFMRALFHFELVKRYGGIPIVTTVFKAGEGTDIARDKYDDCIKFIVDECDKAAAILPVEWSSASLDFGRVTKGAALALKARALLYAASPLFNDSQKPENTIEHGAYDPNKWALAASAANDVIALNYYQLFANYQNFFITINNNKEIVLAKMAAQNNTVERLNGPSGYTGGGGGSCPTLDLVDSYLMYDGSKFDWTDPLHAANPFLDREPRFYASILYNGAGWMGDVIDTYDGGNDLGTANSTRTGFYLKKFMSESAKWFGGTPGNTYHCFPIFRYAEVLLNYAEAQNEASGPTISGTYSLTPLAALNQVRARVGLPAISTTVTKDEFRVIVQNERKIELAFEEHRHMDLRRWKIAANILNKPVKGLKIKLNTDGSFTYESIEVQKRVFKPEMYLYPIPQSEINRSKSLVQNTGW